MASTEIEWCDKVWNPVRGCSRVSAGCEHCYAMGQAHRFSGPGKPYDGLTTIRRGKVDWAGHARLVPEMLDQPLRWKKPQRIFVNSMSDLFHESLSNEDIAAVFMVMAACPQHTFQVLTKRPKRMLEWFRWADSYVASGGPDGAIGVLMKVLGECPWPLAGVLVGDEAYSDAAFEAVDREWPLPNVWLGVSVESQEQADKRIPVLLKTPAAVRFISAEPLLGPVNLTQLKTYSVGATLRQENALRGTGIEFSSDGGGGQWFTKKLDLVIVGGESGHGARECEVSWIRRIVSDCQRAGTPVFVKQLGAYARDQDHFGAATKNLRHKKGADMSEWPEDLRVRQMPGGAKL